MMKGLLSSVMCLCLICGCGALEIIAEGGGGNTNPDGSPDPADIRNWDFSACVEDTHSFGVCKHLLLDNQEVILGGHTFIELLFDGLATIAGTPGNLRVISALGLPPIDFSDVLPPPTDDAPDPADISNWDFSVCLDDLDSVGVCSDLFFDNEELILGGHTFVEALLDGFAVEAP